MPRLGEFELWALDRFGRQVEAAAAFGVAQNTLSQWITKGEIPRQYHQKAQELGYKGGFMAKAEPDLEAAQRAYLDAHFAVVRQDIQALGIAIQAIANELNRRLPPANQ